LRCTLGASSGRAKIIQISSLGPKPDLPQGLLGQVGEVYEPGGGVRGLGIAPESPSSIYRLRPDPTGRVR